MSLTRGSFYAATISLNVGQKPYLVVSNNAQIRALRTALVVRLTTSSKPEISSIVRLPDPEDFAGSRVLRDDIEDLYADEVVREAGALSPAPWPWLTTVSRPRSAYPERRWRRSGMGPGTEIERAARDTGAELDKITSLVAS